MKKQPFFKSPQIHWSQLWESLRVYFALAFFSISVLLYLGKYDYKWTVFLRENKSPLFTQIMGQTLFEGHLPGATDPAILFLLASLFFYFLSYTAKVNELLLKWRPFLGFFLVASMTGALGLVHGLKWIIGRARPYEVLDHQWPYSEWYEFGPHYVLEGLYSGSFPSGHTAAVVIPILLSFIWLTDYEYKKVWLGWLWGVLFTLNGAAMAVGRVMNGSHWLTDSLGILVPLLLLCYWVYFDLLKIPQQRAYYCRNGKNPDVPRCWEFIFCLYGLFIALGLILWFWGVRSFQFQEVPWLVLLMPISAVLISYFLYRMWRLYQKAFEWLP